MEASKSLIGLVFVTIMTGLISTSESYVFSVGDRSGWVENPPVPYNNWAGSKRFSINDTLVFNYKKGQDSVLVVNKESYDSCNISSPIQTLNDSNSAYKFVSAGPHYFISGAAGHCGKGEKVIVVVLSIRNKPVPSPPATPTPSTPSPSPTPSTPPSTPSPSPSPSTPTPSTPSPSPSTPPLTPSPSPTPFTPTPSTPSPSPSTPTPSTPSPSPRPSTPPSPSPTTPLTPSTPTPSTPSTPTPSTQVSPPPPKAPSSSSVFRVSWVSMGLAALVLGALF